MVATIEQLKKAELLCRFHDEVNRKIEFRYSLYGTDRRSPDEDVAIATDLWELTKGLLAHEGFKISEAHCDLWPCHDFNNDEEYTLIVMTFSVRP